VNVGGGKNPTKNWARTGITTVVKGLSEKKNGHLRKKSKVHPSGLRLLERDKKSTGIATGLRGILDIGSKFKLGHKFVNKCRLPQLAFDLSSIRKNSV